MEWKDVTVFQWQQLAALSELKLDDFEFDIQAVAILYNMTENEINGLNAVQFHRLLKEIQFIQTDITPVPAKYVFKKNKRYRCVYDVRKINAARYIESKHYAKDVTNNLHKIMASLIIPQKRNVLGVWVDDKYDIELHSQYSEDMLQAPITSVFGSVLFFCSVYIDWIASSKDYLIELMEMKMETTEAEKLYQDLWDSTVGFIKPNWYLSTSRLN